MTDKSNQKDKKEQELAAVEATGTNEEVTEVQAQEEAPTKGKKRAPRASAKKKPLNVNPDLEERVVVVNRVAKVVKGGRRFSFSAIMVVGDKKGRVGHGLGKAKEVPEAIRKATQAAQRRMVKVHIENGTIPHEIMGEFDGGKILFRPAAEGTGVKAAGACRSILELAGVKNVLTKSLRGGNPHNIVKATFNALEKLRSIEEVAQVRGKDVKKVRYKK